MCLEQCTKQFPCGHYCTERCGAPCTPLCKEEIIKDLPCGHQESVPCYVPLSSIVCSKSCKETLLCGHPRVLVLVLNVIWEDCTSHASLRVVALYPAATAVTFPVQMNVLHAHNPTITTAITVDAPRNAVSYVFLVWTIVSGGVSISSVPRNAVRCVIALVVMVHALKF